MTNDEINKKDDLRNSYFNSINLSEEDLEKKITYISAGGLALSITFIEKIVDLEFAKHFWILIIGWILLASTLFINLISTYVSRRLTMKSVDDIDKNVEEEQLKKNINKRNKIISNLDFSSLMTLLIGISFVVLFCSLNLANKKSKVMGDREIIEKGKLIQTPSTSGNSGNGSTGNNSNNTSGNQSNTQSSNKSIKSTGK